MGIDAFQAVALKKDSSVEAINQRFRNHHSRDDGCFYKNRDLITGLVGRDDENFEYINTYWVSTGLVRYYGIGYERGPIVKLVTQLEWLRAQPEVIEVYYGGDSSDAPSRWTEEDSKAALWHFFKFGHSPYAQWHAASWDKDETSPAGKTP